MPELPEVQTTVNGVREHTVGLVIRDVWTNYNSQYFRGTESIKDPLFFKYFRKEVLGKKIISVERRGKNILINLSAGSPKWPAKSILVHMKMTGHLLYGQYKFNAKAQSDPWEPISPEGLKDPFNRRIRFMISFTNNKHLALSDMRRFAKVTLVDTKTAHESEHLLGMGPEPLEKRFDFAAFNERLDLRPNGKIKPVLLDQNIIAGIGNIYTDESLWRAGIHPLSIVKKISPTMRQLLFKAIKTTLARGIDFGGDSTSDYRDVLGEKGKFQEQHMAYRRTGSKCGKPGCTGKIIRIVVGGRGTHLCDAHQKLR